MVDRPDPARAGVKAGRVVGLLTGVLVVVTVGLQRDSLYVFASDGLGVLGVESSLAATALVWGNALVSAVGRYGFSYVVGSLVGVVYDWLEDPPVPVLVGIVLGVGIVDGTVSGVDARSVAIGGGYVLAWLCYVPAFLWFEEDSETTTGPRRLG